MDANRRKPPRDTLRQLRLKDPYVVSSPRKRAQVTAELAGLTVDDVDEQISEWDYGDYEGTTTEEIRKAVPNWLVWTHGCPGGETSAADLRTRGSFHRTGVDAHGVPRRGLRWTRPLLPCRDHPLDRATRL